ncbi:MAG: HNH endonuclease [Alphaproteobacteria bacterium]|nr:HNH endonuclease [Alphaproteobacteria bacterium]
MTNDQIRDILRYLKRLVVIIDESNVKKLFKIFIGARDKNSRASFLYIDTREAVKQLLSDLINSKNINKVLTRHQVKRIYTILGDYHIYPVCRLCGKPIKIDTFTQRYSQQSNQMTFSWDHKYPKSKGGTWALTNMQPTHKICNTKRGIKPLCKERHKTNMKSNIDIMIDPDTEKLQYRPTHFSVFNSGRQYCA